MAETIVDAEAGIVKCEHTKFGIIGAGPSRERAPWDDDAYCWQMLNEIPQPRRGGRFHRHWEIHPMAPQSLADMKWLNTCPTPCYVLDLNDITVTFEKPFAKTYTVKNSVQYPLARLKAAGLRTDFFTCTFAMQIALALLDGFETIGLWGVELSGGSARERLVEHCCTAYWLGVAEGRGVKIANDCRLTWQPYLYGYDYDKEKTYVESGVSEMRRVIDYEAKVLAERESRRVD